MILTFRRTAHRCYAIEAYRDTHADLEMNPAPGYDPLVPHDLLHLVVEAILGLTYGVFGQLAAGGDAASFHLLTQDGSPSREVARQRRRLQKCGAILARKGKNDAAQSERAAYVCWQAWLMRSKMMERRALGKSMAEQARQVRGLMTPEEQQVLDAALDTICRHLDELSATWSRLAVGEAMSIRWPSLTIYSKRRSRARPVC